MSLGDRLNRNSDDSDLSPIERLDARLTRSADGWGEAWRRRTGRERQSLTLGLYVAATLGGLAYVALTGQVLFLGIAFLAYAGSAPGKQRGSLVEEIQLEAAGLPRRTLKYLAVFMFGLGLFGVLTSLPFVLLGLGGVGSAFAELPGLVGGAAITALKVADYIARTNPDRRDGDRERQIERVGRRSAVPMAA